MKECEFCDKLFEITVKGSGGQNRTMCYECLPDGLPKKERTEVRRLAIRKKIAKIKLETGCSICGYSRSAKALEYHHTIDDKDLSPPNAAKRSFAKFQEETKNCVLLCANCHREVHEGLISV